MVLLRKARACKWRVLQTRVVSRSWGTVAGLHLFPALRTQYRRGLLENNPLIGGVHASIQEYIESGIEQFPGIFFDTGPFSDGRRRVVNQVFDHCGKQFGLVLEVVIKRPAGNLSANLQTGSGTLCTSYQTKLPLHVIEIIK
jgi:hypothetical protein